MVKKSTRRKNAAGGWLRGQVLKRFVLSAIIVAGAMGAALGCFIGVLVTLGGLAVIPVWLGTLGVAVLAVVGCSWYVSRVEASWGRGLEAERQIGDFIELAVVKSGCAFAHDVKEGLGGPGNVDHVVMTPVGIWVVETKARRVSKQRFPSALSQVAENVRRVRRHLETSVTIRGALVIADRADDSLDSDRDWNGEVVKVFGAKRFLGVLRAECKEVGAIGKSVEMKQVEAAVWQLGSTGHAES